MVVSRVKGTTPPVRQRTHHPSATRSIIHPTSQRKYKKQQQQAQPRAPLSTASMQNPSCLLYGPGDARFENIPLPTIEDPYDVIIRIAYVGVCGSDVCC
jgi:hypothetical protein